MTRLHESFERRKLFRNALCLSLFTNIFDHFILYFVSLAMFNLTSKSILNSAQVNSCLKIIHDICYKVDLEIEGLDPRNALIWASFNSRRHFNALLKILDSKPHEGPVKILNASGCSNGTQAFSICACLSALNIEYQYHCIESPHSSYLERSLFQDFCRKFSVHFIYHDYSETCAIKLPIYHSYDIVLFTEIAEHLDHTALIDSLELVLSCLAPNGRVFITTPNLLRISNRIKFIFGSSTSLYWGDGTLNRSAKSYGHITLYAIDRLKLLLQDSGFEILESVTTNYGLPPYPPGDFYRPLILTVCFFLSNFVPYSQDSIEIYAIANCNEYSKIPLAY